MLSYPLFLSDVSGTEVLVILIFVLMFFGSKSIPGIARTLGRTMRQIKDASNEIQNEIKQSGVDMKKDLNLTRFVEETVEEFKQPLDQYAVEINEAVQYQPPRKKVIAEENKDGLNQISENTSEPIPPPSESANESKVDSSSSNA
jgi:TatA/E family protein of Tat protein translocase